MSFADRLNRLFETVRAPNGGLYTNTEVAQWVTDAGGRLSAPYLSQLRSGRNPRPAYDIVSALSAFFGVRPEYFSNEAYAYRVGPNGAASAEGAKAEGAIEIARRSAGLSLEAQSRVLRLAEQLAKEETEDRLPGET